MKVMVFVKSVPGTARGAVEEERDRLAMDRYNDELVAAGMRLNVAGLRPMNESVRLNFTGEEIAVIADRSAASREHVVGFWIWQVRSMDEAIAWAKRCPFPSGDVCVLELRQFNEQDE